MPIYEYSCRNCGNEFELLVIGRDTPACPQCGGTQLEKLMATFAHRSGGGRGTGAASSSASSGSKCSGCAGGSCRTCH